MPGFFESMKRIAQGKPVFDAADNQGEYAPNHPEHHEVQGGQHASTEHQSRIMKGNDRTFPVVYVKRTVTRFDGPNMAVYCDILNTWPEPVELDKIHILGKTHELDAPLRAGQEREFVVYKGPRVKQKITQADLEYKTHHEHDYFKAIHDVTFMYHSEDQTYSVDELRLRMPIRDIYG